MSEPSRTELAVCVDCSWRDGQRGARGRGALHNQRTGHAVNTTLTTSWPRAGAPPGSEPFPELASQGHYQAPALDFGDPDRLDVQASARRFLVENGRRVLYDEEPHATD